MISNINKTKSKKPKGGIQIGNIANTKYYKMPDGSVIDDQGKPAPAAIVAALQPVMQKESVLVSKSKKISSIERKDKSKEKNYFAIDKNIITSLLKSLNSLTTKMNKVLDESKKITLRYNVLNKNIQTSDLIMTNRARSFVEEINKLKDDVSQIFKSAPKFSQTGAIASAITPTSDMSKDIKGTPEKDNQGNSETEGLLAGIFGGAVAGSLMKSILRTVVKTVLSRPFMIAAGIATFMYQYQKEQVRRQKKMGFTFDPSTGKALDENGNEISQEEIEKRSRKLRQEERDTGTVDQGIKFKGRKEVVGERKLIQEIMEGKKDLEIGILPNQSENEKNKIREQEAQKVNNGTTKLKVIPVERQGGLTGKTNTNEKSDTEKKNIEKVQNQNAVIEQRTVLIDQVKQGKKDAELYIDDKLPEREKNLTRENAALRVAQGISWEEITRGRREYDTQKKIIDQQKNASANNASSDTSKDFNQFKPTETNFGAFGESPVSSPQSVSTAPVAPPAATPTAPVAPAPAPGPSTTQAISNSVGDGNSSQIQTPATQPPAPAGGAAQQQVPQQQQQVPGAQQQQVPQQQQQVPGAPAASENSATVPTTTVPPAASENSATAPTTTVPPAASRKLSYSYKINPGMVKDYLDKNPNAVNQYGGQYDPNTGILTSSLSEKNLRNEINKRAPFGMGNLLNSAFTPIKKEKEGGDMSPSELSAYTAQLGDGVSATIARANSTRRQDKNTPSSIDQNRIELENKEFGRAKNLASLNSSISEIGPLQSDDILTTKSIPQNQGNKLSQLSIEKNRDFTPEILPAIGTNNVSEMSSTTNTGTGIRPNVWGLIEPDQKLGSSSRHFATYQPNRYLYNEDDRYFSNSVA